MSAVSIFIILFFTFIPFFMRVKSTLLDRKEQLFEQVEITRCILNLSNEDDLVFDSYGKPIFRHHPLDPKFTVYNPQKFIKLSAIKKANPKFLIKDQYYQMLPDETFAWFEENFVSISENENIFVRKDG